MALADQTYVLVGEGPHHDGGDEARQHGDHAVDAQDDAGEVRADVYHAGKGTRRHRAIGGRSRSQEQDGRVFVAAREGQAEDAHGLAYVAWNMAAGGSRVGGG